MARKKASEEEVVIEEYNPGKIRERIAKEIEANLGYGVIVSGNEIIERPRTIIPVSPRIDSIIGGGVPEGSWVVLLKTEPLPQVDTTQKPRQPFARQKSHLQRLRELDDGTQES